MAFIGITAAGEALDAMGIDKKDVIGLEVRMYPDEPVTIKLERYMRPDEMTGLVGWFRKRFGTTTTTETVVPDMKGAK